MGLPHPPLLVVRPLNKTFFVCVFPHLVVEEKLSGVVTLEEEVQVVQHGRVIEHEVHDLMT